LAEELAPRVLAREQPEQVALLVLVGPGLEDRRAGPTDADRVVGSAHPGPTELLVDDDLVDRIGVETPRRRPVRGDVARLGQLTPRRVRVGLQPRPHRRSAGIVVTG